MDKNCKLIRDLLPSYLDHVTSEDTSKFVEEHLNKCEECKKFFDEMNSEVDKENVKDIEIVKEIKKYKRKIFRLKLLVAFVLVIILSFVLGNLGYKYYIVKNSIDKSIINGEFYNYRIDEYEESIEKYEEHYTTYICNGTLKKIYENKPVEYWTALDDHYYIDNENKTYYIVKEPLFNSEKHQFSEKIVQELDVIPEYKELVLNKEKNPLEILKFILFTDDIYVGREGFRNEEYYIIRTDFNYKKIFIDMDTFHVERIQNGSGKSKEYRVSENAANYHNVKMVDLTGYTEIKK